MKRSTPIKTSVRQARSREARAKEGGRTLSTFLHPPAAEKLADWVEGGHGVADVINSLLRKSRPTKRGAK